MSRIDDIISDVIKAEGSYSDNKNDTGGKTKFGITEAVARENGYTGDMHDLTEDFARKVYYQRYVIEPRFDRVLLLSPMIAGELVDTGVNCGQGVAAKFLQRCLNAFNQRGVLWSDLVVDGGLGDKSIAALAAYLKARGSQDGERVLFAVLNAMQSVRYVELSESRQENEDFEYGWQRNRVEAQLFSKV